MKNKLLNKKITIIGLGLIGGSIAMALKEKGFTSITGFSRTKSTLEKAKSIKAIDKIASSPAEAVENSDLVIICTPISKVKDILIKIKNHIKIGCVVTDVASTKEEIINFAQKISPKQVIFIGGHPMAGKETSGLVNANKKLFQNCTWCLVPTTTNTARGMEIVKSIVKKLGGKPLIINPKIHDEAVTTISHLPFILSAITVFLACKQKNWNTAQKLASGGFRDITRLAGGNTQMHTDICLTNSKNIVAILNSLTDEINKLILLIQKNERGKLFQFFELIKIQRKESLCLMK